MDEKKISAGSMMIALIALMLSQLKPIYQYFESPNFELELAPYIQVGQNLGNTILMPFLQLKNSGSELGYVRNVEFFLENIDNSSLVKKIPAQQYYLTPSSVSIDQVPSRLPFGDLSIAEGESWEAYVEIFEQLSPDTLQEFTAIRAAVAREVTAEDGSVISDELYERIRSFVSSNMSWFKEGRYRILVLLWEDDQKDPIIKQGYKFAVKEEDIDLLNSVTERFRYGEFIVKAPKSQNGFYAKLTRIDGSEEINELYRRYLEL